VAAGIFCPLGAGSTDFTALHTALVDHHFDGWATVEQDIDPARSSDALTDARRSLRYLREIGIAEPQQAA